MIGYCYEIEAVSICGFRDLVNLAGRTTAHCVAAAKAVTVTGMGVKITLVPSLLIA
jgi:hypothetical protein